MGGFKRECLLRPSEILKKWHMMKKSKLCIFRPEILHTSLKNVVGFFSRNIFFKPGKIEKTVTAPRGLKNTRNKHGSHLLVNFVLFNSHQRKPSFLLKNLLLKCLLSI